MIFPLFTSLKNLPKTLSKLGGVFSDGVPPDSIPNSEVKPVCGENSAEVARCQNSSMPPFIYSNPLGLEKLKALTPSRSQGFFVCVNRIYFFAILLLMRAFFLAWFFLFFIFCVLLFLPAPMDRAFL